MKSEKADEGRETYEEWEAGGGARLQYM